MCVQDPLTGRPSASATPSPCNTLIPITSPRARTPALLAAGLRTTAVPLNKNHGVLFDASPIAGPAYRCVPSARVAAHGAGMTWCRKAISSLCMIGGGLPRDHSREALRP